VRPLTPSAALCAGAPPREERGRKVKRKTKIEYGARCHDDPALDAVRAGGQRTKTCEGKVFASRCTHSRSRRFCCSENRSRARGLMREFVPHASARSWVRINPIASPDYADDLEAVAAAPPAGVVVPSPIHRNHYARSMQIS